MKSQKIKTQKIKILVIALIIIGSAAIAKIANLDANVAIAFFVVGSLVGVVSYYEWMNVLADNAEFYVKFYDVKPYKVHRKYLDREMFLRHTRNVLPFYLLGVLVFAMMAFTIAAFNLAPEYMLILAMGLLEGSPVGHLRNETKS